jgi:anti-sigma B factor antagonist
MNYSFENSQTVVILKITDALLAYHHQAQILDELKEWIANDHVNFIIDLANLSAINSTGLNVLVSVLTQARNAGGDVVLANLPEHLSKLLVITKLNSIFTICRSIEEAKEQFLTTV